MPSFLIVHAAVVDGRIDAYRQPPVLDIGGLRAPLDWGDVTLHVPAGDLPVTIAVTRANGMVEGATITVRAPAGTGTRLTFIPPLHPGSPSQLRIEGQWPSDPSMHYYAARDARTLVAPTRRPSVASASAAASAAAAGAAAASAASAPLPPTGAVRVVSPAAIVSPALAEASPNAAPPAAVGPAPGSTAAVPQRPTYFGHEQGARVDPVQAAPAAAASDPAQPPSFGQRPAVEHDVYGRERAAGDRRPPPVPTPADFDRLEREAHEAQVRAFEAWQAQQSAAAPSTSSPDDGAPEPLGLGGGSAGRARPDWYADPYRRADARWFDGHQWTASVLLGGARATDQPG